jgi:transcriptional regulator with XRE-family HTH domain
MAKSVKRQPSTFREITVLRELRERAGLTREQLVTRLHNRIALRTLQDWENLGREPSMTRQDWLNFCEAINVRWEDLPESLSVLVEKKIEDKSQLIAIET